MFTTKQNDGFSVKAYRGDAKTLLAFNLTSAKAKKLAGFTIQVAPDGQPAFFLQNNLRFKEPSKHAQDAKLPPTSSFNAPIHKFRWVHVPGSLQQGTQPFFGSYTYTVTPRYFDDSGSLLPFDPKLSVAVKVDVMPFEKGAVAVGFTRGFVQSQAFVHHFGPKAIFRPKTKDLLFDTSQVSGKNSLGGNYTFADEYDWLGFTARDRIFTIVNEVLKNKNLHLDVFAYDLNEPDVMTILLQLAKQGRIRVILDNASLHHDKPSKKAPKKSKATGKSKPSGPKPEDQFEQLFLKAAKKSAAIMRGMFGRFAHDKVFIVSKIQGKTNVPVKVLTGSTNFSVTGLYVNSNHIVVFNDPTVAAAYAHIFQVVWDGKVNVKFNKTDEARKIFSFSAAGLPQTEITFSPHQTADATKNLDNMVARINQEPDGGSVLFAVMGLDKGTGPVLPALKDIHKNTKIFSYGISDTPGGIFLYSPRQKTGALVSGKPTKTKLPPPFDQVPSVGLGHQIHHKFVVCGFNGKNPVVFCGSSNLAEMGEEVNGDNLIAIHDTDIATVFAIEALTLVDHFDFLDRSSTVAKQTPAKIKAASKQEQADKAQWFLSTSDRWVQPYFDKNDLRCVDRELFG